MRILGVTDGVMAGAALIEDGRLVAAINEERVTRMKMARGFPRQSIAEVLRLASVEMKDLDGVAVSSLCEFFCPNPVPWEGWFQGDRGAVSEAFRSVASEVVRFVGSSRLFQSGYYSLKKTLTSGRVGAIRRLFEGELGFPRLVEFFDHHECHAWTAYVGSGFDRCLVVTLDGGGDGLCARIYRGNEGRLEPLAEVPAYDSIGNFYAYMTHRIGFKAHRDEGKISGLAAHGRPIYRDLLLGMISHDNGSFSNHRRVYYKSALQALRRLLPEEASREDLASSIQSVLESEVRGWIDHWVCATGESNLALAGGVFANVRLNQEILSLDGVRSVFIYPAMGDDGLAAGAGLAATARRLEARGESLRGETLSQVYLGSTIRDREVERLLAEEGIPHRPIRNRGEEVEEIVKLLAAGEVVARCTGAMEYGPRALGHRSILARPDDPTMQDWLNDALRRTEFMPFAPATTSELAPRCFSGLSGGEAAARFMTITFDCLDEFKERCSGVVHVDGTARPQIVDREADPGFHEVIQGFHDRTGLPAVVNTSFNLHEEPIVLSPQDALRAWREVGILHLFLGGFLVPARQARGL